MLALLGPECPAAAAERVVTVMTAAAHNASPLRLPYLLGTCLLWLLLNPCKGFWGVPQHLQAYQGCVPLSALLLLSNSLRAAAAISSWQCPRPLLLWMSSLSVVLCHVSIEPWAPPAHARSAQLTPTSPQTFLTYLGHRLRDSAAELAQFRAHRLSRNLGTAFCNTYKLGEALYETKQNAAAIA